MNKKENKKNITGVPGPPTPFNNGSKQGGSPFGARMPPAPSAKKNGFNGGAVGPPMPGKPKTPSNNIDKIKKRVISENISNELQNFELKLKNADRLAR